MSGAILAREQGGLQVPLAWIAALRILAGLVILTTWASNLAKGFYTPDGLVVFFSDVFPLSENPLTWYAAFIERVILPWRAPFATFQLMGELLLGLALLAGILTPLACVAGLVFVANVFLATFGADWPWSYGMLFAILGVCFFTRAGRSLGLDALLLKRYGEARGPWW